MAGTCAVRFTRYYDATPTEVWAALTEPASLGRWLAPVEAIEVVRGGSFEFRGEVSARVRDVEPERVLELDWVDAGSVPSIVRFELSSDGDGTVLVLDHRRVDALLGMRAMARWDGSLRRLDAVLAR